MTNLYVLNNRNEVQHVKTKGEALERGVGGYYVIGQNGQIYYDFWSQGFYKSENNLKDVIAHLEWLETADEKAYQEWLADDDQEKCGFVKRDFSEIAMLPATDRLRKLLMRFDGRAYFVERPYCLDKQGRADLDTTALRRRHMLIASAAKIMDVLAKDGHEAALALLRHLENADDNEHLAEKLGINIQDISGIRHHGHFRNFCRREYPYLYEAYLKQRFETSVVRID